MLTNDLPHPSPQAKVLSTPDQRLAFRTPRTLLLVVVLACARAAPAETTTDWDLAAALEAGGMLGYRSVARDMATAGASLDVEPSVAIDDWRLRVPAELSMRETWPTSLAELRSELRLAVEWRRDSRLRIGLEGGARLVLRPGWPDPYQPQADGTLARSDRHSYVRPVAEATIAGIPVRHHHARLVYGYAYSDYREDGDYDPLQYPDHLAPADNERHSVRAVWHWLDGGWRVGGEVDASWTAYRSAYARDAGTGATHAGPGGASPNPLLELWSVEPAVDARVELLDGVLTLRLGYGHPFVIDAFQGYGSYQGPHVSAGIEVRPLPGLEIVAEADLEWRFYGEGGYAAGGDHPPLDDGSSRTDHRYRPRIELRYALTEGLSLTGAGEYLARRTNYPDYVPGVFPASRSYAIDWDYDDWLVLAGLEYRVPGHASDADE
ncbi:MAG: hypothetical protein HY907_14265 [Deltaproteobacteria bacterium]|nr:hypothetical protein [Deltaproteobacteria bacterium]